MKRIFAVFAAVLMLCGLMTVPASAADEDITINVYNWAQYISDGSDGYLDVNAAFTEATGIKVNYMTFDTNESLYTKLKTGGTSIDVIIPSDYMIGRLISEDMLLPLDFNNIPNYAGVDDSFKNTEYDPENLYSVPYTWGTVGIIYNSKYVTEPVSSWNILWDEQYKGKILMFDNPRDSFGIAELIKGYSLNTSDETELKDSAELLKQQTGVVQAYVMDQIFSAMEREEAWIAPYYAGDYLMMVQTNPDLKFCFPDEGFNVFIDAMCIPDCCTNKAAAEAYINFLCTPEISGQNLEYLGYSTPISAAKEYMDESVTSSNIAYPDSETLSRAASFSYLSAETNQLMDSLWLDVKTDGGKSYTVYIIAAVVVVIIAAVVIGLSVRKKKKAAARKKRRESRG